MSCSGGTLYCPKSPNFFTKSRDHLNYHIAKNTVFQDLQNNTSVNYVTQNFPAYALRQHKNTQNGTQFGFGTSNIDVEDIVGDVDDHGLREEFEPCKHVSTDTKMENGRHRIFNFAMSLLNDKLDYVFKELECAAKVNFAFGFVATMIEDGMCR